MVSVGSLGVEKLAVNQQENDSYLNVKRSIKYLCQVGFLLSLLICSAAYGALDVNKSFSPAVITATEVTTVTVKLLNSSLNPATQASFTDILPDNVFIAAVPDSSTTCGGTVTYSNSVVRGELSLTGGVVPAGDGTDPGSCEVTINVYPATKGTFVNTISGGDASAMYGAASISNTQSTEATLVAILSDVTGTLSHSIDYLQGGEVHTATITLNNPNDVDLTEAAFDLDLGTIIKAVDGSAETTCADGLATLTLSSSSIYSTVSLAEATIPANGSCTISYDVERIKPPTDAHSNSSPYITLDGNSISTNEGATNATPISGRIRVYSGLILSKYFDASTDSTLELFGGNTAELTIVLKNYNILPVVDFDLTDTMPTSGTTGVMSVESIDANTCGGVVSHTSTSLTVTGATLEGAEEYLSGIQIATCTITATVSVNGTGTYTNDIPAGDFSGFNHNAATAKLTAVSDVISITKAFASNFYQGDTKTLEYTFVNNTDISSGIDATGLAFDDEFETATTFFVLESPNVSTSCPDALVTAIPYSQQVSVSNLTVPKGSSCTVTVDVGVAADAYPVGASIYDYVPVGDITYEMNGIEQVYSLEVVSKANLQTGLNIYKSFTPDIVGPLGVTRLEIMLRHRAHDRFGIDQVSFTDVLPTGHVIASPAKAVNECGGTLVAAPGTDTISLSDGMLPAGEKITYCYIYVNVQVPALSDGASIETAKNTIPGVPHGETPLNLTARRIGYPSGYNLMENYYNATAKITRQDSSIAVNKEFLPVSINGGGVSRVRITFSNVNSAAIDLTEVALTDNFTGTDLRLHTDVDPSFTDVTGSTTGSCRGGVFTGAYGDTSITLEDASVDQGATCRMEFNVTANVGGNHINSIAIGDVTSLEGITNDILAATTLTVGRQVNVGKGFVPDTIAEDETSVLTLEIFNTNDAVDEEGAEIALIDEMPAGLSVENIISNSCGGSVSTGTQNGNDTITLAGGFFMRASTCEVKATVSGSVGVYTNVIGKGDLEMVSGAHNADNAEATLTIIEKPTIVKSFSPSAIIAGDRSTVTLRIYNPNGAVDFTRASLTDTLTNMVIATPPDVGGSCGDIEYIAETGSNLFTLTNASIPAGTNCTVTFKVVSTVTGVHDNQTSGLTVAEMTIPGSESNIASISVVEPLVLTKTFSPDSITSNGVSQLIFTLTNPNESEIDIGSTGFTDTFPTSPGNMIIASPVGLSNTCGSDVLNAAGESVTSGDSAIRITDGSVPANDSCSISLNIEVDAPGTYENTTSTLTTTSGTTPSSSDTLTVELVRTISGSVKNDDDGDGTGDTGVASVSVSLFNLDGSIVQVDGVDLTTTTDGSGRYSFSLTPGNYIVESVDKEGYLSVSDTDGENDNKITVDTTSADSTENNFVDSSGFAIQGRVYNDKNADGVNDSDEIGVTSLPVVLLNVTNNECISVRTDAEGNYSFLAVSPGDYKLYEASREHVPVPGNCDETMAKDPVGYRSTTANVIAQFSVVNADITGKDFGDAKPPIFEPDHSGQILPGNVVFYTHKFATPTTGSVSFSNIFSGNKSAGWSSLLYQDVNCDGALNQSDASTLLVGALAVDAGESVCLINKVYAPANVAANDSYIQQIEATFRYGSTIAGVQSLTVQDVTTAQQIQAPTSPATPEVAAESATTETPAVDAVAETPVKPEVGPSRLELRKTVRNVTSGSAETSTANTAEPGDILEYRIYYRNSGTGPVTELVIDDTVPPYTELYGSADCGSVLTDMSCVISALGNDDIQWIFSGSLAGGSESSVSYRVLVDD